MAIETWSYTTLSEPGVVFDAKTRRRVEFLMLIDRETPAGLKVSRRSRRRWRGRGGVWTFSDDISALARKAGLL